MERLASVIGRVFLCVGGEDGKQPFLLAGSEEIQAGPMGQDVLKVGVCLHHSYPNEKSPQPNFFEREATIRQPNDFLLEGVKLPSLPDCRRHDPPGNLPNFPDLLGGQAECFLVPQVKHGPRKPSESVRNEKIGRHDGEDLPRREPHHVSRHPLMGEKVSGLEEKKDSCEEDSFHVCLVHSGPPEKNTVEPVS